LASKVLYLVLWNKVMGDLDHFIGQVRIPISSLNLCEEVRKWYPLDSKGTNIWVKVKQKQSHFHFFRSN